MTSTRSASDMISSSSSVIRRIAAPAARRAMSMRWTDSIAPTSRPRVGWTAMIRSGLRLDLAGEDQALEVATREQPGLRCRSTALRSRSARASSRRRRAPGRVDQPAAGDRRRPVGLHDEVVGDRQVRRAADAGPILGDVGDALADRLAGGGVRDVASVDPDASRACPQPGDHLGQLALPVAGDRRDPDDLAAADRERCAAQRGQFAVVDGLDVAHLEDGVARAGPGCARRSRPPRARPSAGRGRRGWIRRPGSRRR